MASEINRKCPFCGEKLTTDTYKQGKTVMIVYCDNCNNFCSDATSPTRVLEELKCIACEGKEK